MLSNLHEMAAWWLGQPTPTALFHFPLTDASNAEEGCTFNFNIPYNKGETGLWKKNYNDLHTSSRLVGIR
jgi:hypothetical protein